MAKKLVNNDHITIRDLSGCEYSWDEETHVIGCRNKREHQVGSLSFRFMASEDIAANDLFSQTSKAGKVVVHEAKITSTTESQCSSYVWNSDFKTIEGRIRAKDAGTSSSDLSVSDGTTTVTPLLSGNQESNR